MMKIKFLPALSFLVAAFFFLPSCDQQAGFNNKEIKMPIPTNGETIIHEGGEDADNQNKREQWFELMHSAAPGTSWRKIEEENSRRHHKARLALKKDANTKNGFEYLADSLLTGSWYERGSRNQAGNVGVTEYDQEEDIIYTVSGGGSIFKGKRDGSNWEVVNQDFKFHDRIFNIIDTPSGKRFLAAAERVPYYSDDMGETWIKADGPIQSLDFWGNISDPIIVTEGGNNYIYLLHKEDYWDNVQLYASTDNGASYQSIKNFSTNSFNNLSLCNPHHTKDVYLFEKNSSDSNFHKINHSTNTLEFVNFSSFGIGNANAHLTASEDGNGGVIFYIYNENNQIHKSTDFGSSWTFTGNLPASPWGVGIYVSKFDPTQLYMGEVEAHKSSGDGIFWNKVNGWGEYYSNVVGALHADIMYFNEFETSSGEEFMLVSNHGGLSISYNNLLTTTNIGLEGLNVSQYYDVRTDPLDPSYMYAGTQDQGYQRGKAESYNDQVYFDQVISGDYGHIAFSNNGESMWTVYPGGSVSYYDNAQVGGITAGYDLESDNETVWIPPLVETPDPTDNEILMAGGSVTGGPGSFIIRLWIWGGGVSKEEIPFDFHAASGGGTLSAIEISPMNHNLWYAATTNGFFYYSMDAGQNWEQSFVSVPDGHYLYGASIYASTTDENTVYLAGSGYSNAPIIVSTDNGQTFAPMDEGMPSTLAFKIVGNEDESMFFAATEAGPYVYVVEKGKWFSMLGTSAPVQTYWSVEYLPASKTARFGTYGRGIWDFREELPVANEEVIVENKQIKIYPNPSNGPIEIDLTNSSFEANQIQVFDMQGRLLKDINIQKGNPIQQIDLSGNVAGTYLVRITDGKNVENHKVVLL